MLSDLALVVETGQVPGKAAESSLASDKGLRGCWPVFFISTLYTQSSGLRGFLLRSWNRSKGKPNSFSSLQPPMQEFGDVLSHGRGQR